MTLDPDASYRALVARDRRFDGVFFVGVSTTGIYCRPVCTAKTPARARCTFFRRAAEAEKAGYRACFRCRPELAPGASRVDARRGLAARAVMRIEEGALNEGSLDELAAELGVTPRHLRRAVQEELGVSPVELAQTLRLALAKQLLHDTALPVTEVAYASGFASLRRFNALFAARFGRRPTDMRRETATGDGTTGFALSLGYRAPFEWTTLLRFFAGRATRGVELVDGEVYARTLRIGARSGWIRAHHRRERRVLRIELSPSLAPVAMTVAAAARRAFDLDADPARIAPHLRRDVALRPYLAVVPRIPGAFDPFEIAVRAVLGQQISVKGATTLAGRFAETFGDPFPTAIEGLGRLPPTPARIAAASVDAVRAIGLPKARAESLVALARAFASGELGRLAPGADLDETRARLLAIPGIGPWTASYVALRVLGDPDAFLEADLGLQRALGGIDPKALLDRAEAWRPWRAYAALALWTQGSGG